MTHALPRRGLLAGAVLVAAPIPRARAIEGGDAIAALERRHGGRLGVFVLDTGTGRTLAWRADERFPMQSTFKAPLAANVLAWVDAGRLRLDDVVRFDRAALVVASPVTSAQVAAGSMTIGALVAATLERSDNTAANLLLSQVGGIAAFDAFLRLIGDRTTRLDHREPIDSARGDEDTTTPRAMAATMRAIGLGGVLAPVSRARLLASMVANVPGRTRLRAALPAGWRTADRTGTTTGVCNDVAIIWPPGRPPLVVAAFRNREGEDDDDAEALLRAVGAAVAGWAAA